MFTPTQSPSYTAMTSDVREINQDGEDAWKWSFPFCYINEANIKEDTIRSQTGMLSKMMKGLYRPHKET